jgi:hypothetical protein
MQPTQPTQQPIQSMQPTQPMQQPIQSIQPTQPMQQPIQTVKTGQQPLTAEQISWWQKNVGFVKPEPSKKKAMIAIVVVILILLAVLILLLYLKNPDVPTHTPLETEPPSCENIPTPEP